MSINIAPPSPSLSSNAAHDVSLIRMSTSVHGGRLHGLATDHRGLSREHGPDGAKACRRSQRRRKPGSPHGGWFGVPATRLDAHFGL